MATTKLRDVGRVRRGRAKFSASAWSLLLLVTVLVAGCDLTTPSSPNESSDLTGQTTNQQFTFTGTIVVTSSSSTVSANDLSNVIITAEVRDAAGNPIANLTTVTFSTNLGGFVLPGGVASVASATTFNGLAQLALQSFGRTAGDATVSASLGQVVSSTSVSFEPAPLEATMSAAFGVGGTGAPTATGKASKAVPLNLDVSTLVTDTSGAEMAPLAGGTVRFRITRDTSTGSGNGPARFVVRDDVLTSAAGVATNILRIVGAGDVVVVADLIDPNTGDVAATSNQIVATTTEGEETAALTFTFSDGSTVFGLGGVPPASVTDTITATVADPSSGGKIRFEIRTDSTGGAYLTDVGGTTSVDMATNSSGQASTTITLTDAGQIVVIRATLLDPGGSPTSVWKEITAKYDKSGEPTFIWQGTTATYD